VNLGNEEGALVMIQVKSMLRGLSCFFRRENDISTIELFLRFYVVNVLLLVELVEGVC
jgi:hypothetical protein